MELGRTSELTCLTPSELHWIELALRPKGKHPMAEEALRNAAGRRLTCGVRDAKADNTCGKPATHFYMEAGKSTFGTMRCTCAEHWRAMDPGNGLGLADDPTEAEEPREAAPAGS